jgi:hypothetical protein
MKWLDATCPDWTGDYLYDLMVQHEVIK